MSFIADWNVDGALKRPKGITRNSSIFEKTCAPWSSSSSSSTVGMGKRSRIVMAFKARGCVGDDWDVMIVGSWWRSRCRVLAVMGADMGSPERVMVCPSYWKDILGTEKSATMDPKEPSQCMPKTTSAPSMGSTKKGTVNVLFCR
nr:hypothetical protein [Tanacetum cinerariifolium]